MVNHGHGPGGKILEKLLHQHEDAQPAWDQPGPSGLQGPASVQLVWEGPGPSGLQGSAKGQQPRVIVQDILKPPQLGWQVGAALGQPVRQEDRPPVPAQTVQPAEPGKQLVKAVPATLPGQQEARTHQVVQRPPTPFPHQAVSLPVPLGLPQANSSSDIPLSIKKLLDKYRRPPGPVTMGQAHVTALGQARRVGFKAQPRAFAPFIRPMIGQKAQGASATSRHQDADRDADADTEEKPTSAAGKPKCSRRSQPGNMDTSEETATKAFEQWSLMTAIGLYMALAPSKRKPRLPRHGRRIIPHQLFANTDLDILPPAARAAYLLGIAGERAPSALQTASKDGIINGLLKTFQ